MAIWHNGQLCESGTVDATSAGVFLGWGVFTTLGIKDGRALWLDEHLARLKRDAARCEISVPFPKEELRAGLRALLQANGVRNGLARLTLSRRDDGRWNTQAGSDVTMVALEAAPTQERDLKVCWMRAPELGPLAGVKSTSYLPFLWCWHEARRGGYEEAILLDAGGNVVEAARASLFWVRGGVLGTSPLGSGALDGVGRAVVLRQAQGWNIATREESLPAAELKECDEAFLVSAASGPRAIRSIEGVALLSPNPVFERLLAWWHTL